MFYAVTRTGRMVIGTIPGEALELAACGDGVEAVLVDAAGKFEITKCADARTAVDAVVKLGKQFRAAQDETHRI